jgi:hypothetical protein
MDNEEKKPTAPPSEVTLLVQLPPTKKRARPKKERKS